MYNNLLAGLCPHAHAELSLHLIPSSLNLSQWFSTTTRKMVPYGPLDFSKQQLHEPEGESGYRIPDSAPQLRDELQLYCLTATPYLQDKCYMLPTVGNNHALSSRVMVKLKLTTNTWHRWIPPCLCCFVHAAGLGRGWVKFTLGLLQSPNFSILTGKDHLYKHPQ